jgi:pimeloyl-ACP methyl ester carboxylesterase
MTTFMASVAFLAACLAAPLPLPCGTPTALQADARRAEDVRFPSGDLEFAAELLLPLGERPRPGAVILQGSGDSDRSNAWAAAIAEELARAGLVVLLTDKRGCGASQGDWRVVGFDQLADDALAGVAYLRTRSEVDGERIGLVGLSQGGWVAPVAAARTPDLAFVVAVSSAPTSFSEQSFHEMGNTARAAGLKDSAVREVLEINRAAARYLRNGDWEAYAAARRRGLGQPWAEIAAGFPGESDLPVWTFLRAVMDFDPMPHWLLVEAPVLVLYGAEDEHDNVPVALSVKRLEAGFRSTATQDATVRVLPGAGHGFIDRDRGGLMPEFVEALVGWVETTVAE